MEDCRGAAPQGIFDVHMPVGMQTVHCDEQETGLHLARVVGDPLHHAAQVTAGFLDMNLCQQVTQAHFRHRQMLSGTRWSIKPAK